MEATNAYSLYSPKWQPKLYIGPFEPQLDLEWLGCGKQCPDTVQGRRALGQAYKTLFPSYTSEPVTEGIALKVSVILLFNYENIFSKWLLCSLLGFLSQ